ncbi:hypothetical protein [uncultured Photobacterium sp.]|uniref:hypothetical protein n=1 Tax=uncultured Photobacterium sp. TaxID=173973 RepID=UPI00260730AB|nr:hypothetical protein [uncultured Photobacterium sp.]
MSAVIKTGTPFVIESVLVAALEAVDAEPILVNQALLSEFSQRNRVTVGDILTNRQDYNGRQFFRKVEERWILIHDQDEYNGRLVSKLADKRYLPVSRFLIELGKHYDAAYLQHLDELAEQERIRLEEERKERIEAARQQAIAKAKAQGYSVKENRKGGQIQLVLTRTV